MAVCMNLQWTLKNLYAKLSTGGFIIIDDFGILAVCSLAVIDFRKENKIEEKIIKFDFSTVYWRRE